VRGHFYRPVKKAVSVRIDLDVLEWLKMQGKGYQTRINHILRDTMLRSKQQLQAENIRQVHLGLISPSPVRHMSELAHAKSNACAFDCGQTILGLRNL